MTIKIAPKRKGGRPATGSIEWSDDDAVWIVRVTLPGGKRHAVRMPGIAKDDRDRAVSMGAKVSTKCRAAGAVPEASRETVNEWSKRWWDHLATLDYATVADVKSRSRRILDIIGTTAMVRVTRDQIEDVRDALDREVSGGGIAWKTAHHAWSDLRCMMRDSVNSKNRALRVRSDDPTTGVAPPEKGVIKAKSYLYPAEFSALVSCQAVPLRWRRMFALTVFC